LAGSFCAALTCACNAAAQDHPAKPVRVEIPMWTKVMRAAGIQPE
jgi:hypothetical protein